MLAKPNVKEIIPKAGNRYQSALALSKRARDIEKKRQLDKSNDIRDAVDIAEDEIANGEVLVKINGEYVDKEAKAKLDEENKKGKSKE